MIIRYLQQNWVMRRGLVALDVVETRDQNRNRRWRRRDLSVLVLWSWGLVCPRSRSDRGSRMDSFAFVLCVCDEAYRSRRLLSCLRQNRPLKRKDLVSFVKLLILRPISFVVSLALHPLRRHQNRFLKRKDRVSLAKRSLLSQISFVVSLALPLPLHQNRL